MNFSHSNKGKTNYSKETKNYINPKLQPVEQAMNGLYGMPETDIEDKDHQKGNLKNT
ncbi:MULTISPECIES: DUF4021 domain-containing protein [Bacillus cereus group]|uniref:DUF4021 domain-containing protein n=1 Tax=Bacillus cereus TaxID=1396 RepID=A0AA44Q5U8_BACCE|nr:MULTISPECIES: DUF4021 domain-containing protein [Bacillus cereus group]PFA18516.1 DUF4021 domain-containing protein [Bacillus cereus]PFN04537.1 DUF4021 domain-containing protein [Bacillus cereus]PFR23982.1 DUF4021 domain-containing protein [Bacillus cereus]PFR88527.1 DUF4021 domain-containing protein [Bacillus cereus]PGZ19517.1 DUF4021 domain-containing protein [Bacillus cereus]